MQSQHLADDSMSVSRYSELTTGQQQGTVTVVIRKLCLRNTQGSYAMRALRIFAPVLMLVAMLAACSISAEDADDAGDVDPSETPVMDSQQTDDADDAVVDDDDAIDDSADDSVSDDSVTDDATDDAEVDDATDDTDAVDDAVDDEDEVAEPVEHIIELTDGNEFTPAEITIAPGDTVTWVNMTDQVHTASADPEIATDESHVELPEGAEPWHSGSINPDESFSITLDVPGTYIYFCYPHQDAGMLGTIIVEGPDPETDDAVDDHDAVDDTDVTDDAVDDDDYDTDEVDDTDTDTVTDPATPAPSEPTYRGKDAEK